MQIFYRVWAECLRFAACALFVYSSSHGASFIFLYRAAMSQLCPCRSPGVLPKVLMLKCVHFFFWLSFFLLLWGLKKSSRRVEGRSYCSSRWRRSTHQPAAGRGRPDSRAWLLARSESVQTAATRAPRSYDCARARGPVVCIARA